jgi:putative redox protein
MVKIAIEYTGSLHCSATHGPSKAKVETDAPVDNNGKGESFSPTDLVATAFGACMATIMGIVAQKHQVELKGMKIEVIKEMSADSPRRISKLTTNFTVPLPKTHPKRELIETAALSCPVHHSIHPEIQRAVNFQWQD